MRVASFSPAILLVLLLWGCSSTAREAPQIKGKLTFDYLTKAISLLDEEFSKKRIPLEFTSGGTAENCKAYFSLKQSSGIVEGVNNFIAAQNYVVCTTLRAFQNAKNNEFVASEIANYGEALAKGVALDSFPSSVYQRTDTDRNCMMQVFENKPTIDKYSATAYTEDWLYSLEVKAILNLNGNQKDDWIVWLTDKSKTGNYSILKAFAAYDVDEASMIKLEPLE